MPEPALDLASRFPQPANREVVEFLNRTSPSAHGDLAERLLELVADLPCLSFCPDPRRYAYCLLHTEGGVIFALATGMRSLSFRLARSDVSEALAAGASARSELGTGWVSFEAFPPEVPTRELLERLRQWCRRACEAARAL
jgi:hypothetical protein